MTSSAHTCRPPGRPVPPAPRQPLLFGHSPPGPDTRRMVRHVCRAKVWALPSLPIGFCTCQGALIQSTSCEAPTVCRKTGQGMGIKTSQDADSVIPESCRSCPPHGHWSDDPSQDPCGKRGDKPYGDR